MNNGRQLSLCVFLGSNSNAPEKHIKLTQDLAREISKRKIRLVYGGQFDGLMGVLARQVLIEGGDLIGIVPTTLWHPEAECIECVRTQSLSERKDRMLAESDGFLVLPGGLGTLDEFIYVLALKYIHVTDKPLLILDPDGFWAPLYNQFAQMVDLKYTSPDNLKHFVVCKTLDEVFTHLQF